MSRMVIHDLALPIVLRKKKNVRIIKRNTKPKAPCSRKTGNPA